MLKFWKIALHIPETRIRRQKMIQTVDFEEAKLPSELLNTITNGQLVLITNAGNPVAILSPVSITQSAVNDSQPISTSSRQLDTAKGLVWMSDDFNEPLEQEVTHLIPTQTSDWRDRMRLQPKLNVSAEELMMPLSEIWEDYV
ncbi:hypothetical protein BGP_2395 [Beggiatoa sp. PS]|nr:hypothetical protein BGP_2395 [Beggiatoa sp. PS]